MYYINIFLILILILWIPILAYFIHYLLSLEVDTSTINLTLSAYFLLSPRNFHVLSTAIILLFYFSSTISLLLYLFFYISSSIYLSLLVSLL